MLANLKTHFQISINYQWDECWQTGLMGKLYPNRYAKYPIADIHVSCELGPASKSVFTHVNILQMEKIYLRRNSKLPCPGYNTSNMHLTSFP